MEIEEVDQAFADVVIKKYACSDQALRQLLAQAMCETRQGHLCLPRDVYAPLEQFDELVQVEDNRLYFQRYWFLESRFIDALRLDADEEKRQPSIQALEKLNTEQQIAVQQALNHKFFVLAGGPGTGKTYTARQIVRAHLSFGDLRIALTAPTGKAAVKLKESIGADGEAMTLHALLKVKKTSDFIKKPGFLPYDLIVVDEASMMDIAMWGALLDACLPTTYLIVLGDPAQLPSVESGQVFADLVDVCEEKTCMVRLTECMRTDQQALLGLAKSVLSGKTDHWHGIDYQPELPSIEALSKSIHPHFQSANPPKEDLLQSLKEMQILTPLKKGRYGTDRLNHAIWEYLVSKMDKGDRVAIPIIVRRNAFDLGLSNGDMGVWLHTVDPVQTFARSDDDRVIFEQGEMPAAILPQFDLAYAISFHKSQGSEYRRVEVLLPPGSEQFGRKALYTAITRAREELTISGPWDTIRACIKNDPKRSSGIVERLR